MRDLAAVYEDTRRSIIDFLKERPAEELERPVPATPGWTVKNVVSHLVGDFDRILANDFPANFFATFAAGADVEALNKWTESHVVARADRSFEEIVEEWDGLVEGVYSMMRGEKDWPESVPFFASYVLVTDIGAHLHDIYGAYGAKLDRDGTPVRVGISAYVGGVDLRLRKHDVGKLNFEADKERSAGEGEPEATVRATPFEMFRALAGRRSPDQVRAFDWTGDPEPFIEYFYPYGIREDALVE